MNLLSCYAEAVKKGDLQDCPMQRAILNPFEKLNQSLSAPKSWFSWLNPNTPKGIYLYGSVGVGKTFLMDLFYDNVELKKKKRFHFHHFMQQIDAKLRQLQGYKNPIQQIAKEISESTQLLCFDEFMVDDVAYAMILSDLMQALFARGIILVATSNILPDDLYRNGVQRDRFVPAILAIKNHCEIFHLSIQQDYRLDREPKINTYITPLNPASQERLVEQFILLTHDKFSDKTCLTIQKRSVPCINYSDTVVWFDFSVICNLPRSQLDYLEIADRFDTVIVSNMPILGDKDTLSAILLIHFIDVMYDQGIRLIFSAQAPIDQLYLKGEMVHAFKRTTSRLQEMQSVDYLARHQRRKLPNLV